jgi:hypothetical protein
MRGGMLYPPIHRCSCANRCFSRHWFSHRAIGVSNPFRRLACLSRLDCIDDR